jgi:hypothetical protein
LLHEIQHAIQTIDGFARGGSPSDFTTDSKGEWIDKVSNLENKLKTAASEEEKANIEIMLGYS